MRATRGRRWVWPAGVGTLAVGTVVAAVVTGGKEPSAGHELVPAERGRFRVTVRGSGTVKSGDAVVIKNKVEGRHAILWLIDDGARVEKGDKLLELDSADLEDKKANQEIATETAKANKVTAEKNLEITRKQAKADIDSARVDLRLAILDLEKYTGVDLRALLDLPKTQAEKMDLATMAKKIERVDWQRIDWSQYQKGTEGKYQTALQKAENEITIAAAERQRATDKLRGSRVLEKKGYITANELEADALAVKKKTLDLSVARSEKRLLQRYTRQARVAEYVSAVDQKAFALEKAKHHAEASVADAKANYSAQTAKYEREAQKLAEIKRQLRHCVVRAPRAGKVLHATPSGGRRREQPLAEGLEIREGRELFRMPKSERLVAEVSVHESAVRLVRSALRRSGTVRTEVTTDAIADRTFRGHVRSVATMPDAQGGFMNPGLKVYTTRIAIDKQPDALQPGMSCRAKIVVKAFDDAVHVPRSCVVGTAAGPRVYVPGANGEPQPRPVKVGMENDGRIQITEGLRAGEKVLRHPPLSDPTRGDGTGNEGGRATRDRAGTAPPTNRSGTHG